MNNIPVFKPRIRNLDELMSKLEKTLASGWLGFGPVSIEFEQGLTRFLNGYHTLALSSGTAALHLALLAIEKRIFKRKLNVLSPPITFVSTGHVALYEGHDLKFIDVEKCTGIIDTAKLAGMLERGVKCDVLMLVHNGGYISNLEQLEKLQNKFGFWIIHDCAHAFGGIDAENRLPTTNSEKQFWAWSFQAVKNLPMGDGGALTSQDTQMLDYLDQLRWLGIDKSTIKRSSGGYNFWYEVDNLGYKYQTNDILATVGLHMLNYVDEENQERRNIAGFYKENLEELNEFITPPKYSPSQSTCHFFPLFVKFRDDLLSYLSNKNIFPSMHYRSNTNYKVYSKVIDKKELYGAQYYENHQITLPIYPGLSKADLTRICQVVHKFFGERP